MNHPELIAVPLLMLADYVLTILGAKLSATVYRQHFTTASYELNPLWRQSVDRLRWFNPRHALLAVVVTAGIVAVDQAEVLPEEFIQFALGMLLGAFGLVCGRHLTNVLLFRYLKGHSQEISGNVQLSMKLVLKMSQFNLIGLVPLFAIVVALVPGPYTWGVLVGLLVLAGAHFIWARRAKSAEVPPAPQA